MKIPTITSLIAALLSLPAIALPVTGVTATASSTYADIVAASNMVNNSELSVPDSFTATHSGTGGAIGQWHSQVGVISNVDLTLTLPVATDLNTIYIWQQNQADSVIDRGVKQFDLLVSTDNGVTYTEVATDLVLAQTPSPIAPISAQSFPLVATDVTNVRLHIDNNYGGNVVGLAEVKFDSIPKDPDVLVVVGTNIFEPEFYY